MYIEIARYTDRLSDVYERLDSAYDELAMKYDGFSCNGCEKVCCDRVFIHFTLIEHFHLIEGFRKLSPDKREAVLERAEEYNRGFSETAHPEENFRMLCPLCEENRCILHPHRPLLCRVYGLPGVLKRETGEPLRFPGCWRFLDLHGEGSEPLDRTAFFGEVAGIEKELREKLTYFQRYRKTVAQMILDEKRKDGLIMRTYDFFEGY